MEPLGLTVNHSSSTTTIIIIVIIIIIIIMIIQGVAKLSDEQLDEELRSSGLLWYAKLLLKHQAFVVELFDILLILEFCRCLYSINYSNYFAYFCYSYIVIIMHHMQRPVCAHTIPHAAKWWRNQLTSHGHQSWEGVDFSERKSGGVFPCSVFSRSLFSSFEGQQYVYIYI